MPIRILSSSQDARRNFWLCAAMLFLLALLGVAQAANNPATTGFTQGYVVGTSSVLVASAPSGVQRKQLIIQSGYENPAVSYICFASVPAGSGQPATCSTAGSDNGGYQLSPGQAAEWPSFKDEPVPQGDIEVICSTTNCHVTVLVQ